VQPDPAATAQNVDPSLLEAAPRTASRRNLAAIAAADLARRHASLDADQQAALARLQRLYDDLLIFRRARRSLLRRWLNPPKPPRGVYLHGGVGRGKSFLMDVFYAALPYRRKTRVHFHAFMKSVHAELATLAKIEDPLATVAARVARRYRVICFDEFHVSDVADAMILGRLLTGLVERGIVFVMTSNYPPAGLYPNGLQRQAILPTIALLERELDILSIDAGVDYRLRALEAEGVAYTLAAPGEADARLDALFDRMRAGSDEPPRMTVEGRELTARRRAGSIVWFDFATLCEGPRSQLDYLELARRFAVVIVSDVPRMGPAMESAARRFTWLVDVLYDHRVKLLVSAAAPAEELYQAGPNSQEFARAASRLIEMRTHDYMALPHLASHAATV
jgi:cell division protein ZapE